MPDWKNNRGPKRFGGRGRTQGGEGRPYGGGAPGGRGYRDSGDGSPDRRERFLKRSRQTVMQALKSRDMLLASTTKSIEDLDKTINLLGERFEDWYGIYFPELKAEDKLQFANAALLLDKENIDEKALASIVGQKRASEIAAAAKTSLGVKLSQKDHSECLSLARMIVSMEEL